MVAVIELKKIGPEIFFGAVSTQKEGELGGSQEGKMVSSLVFIKRHRSVDRSSDSSDSDSD